MDNYILKWQEFSIKLAKQANGSGLKVGAVLVSEQNKIICTSCSSSDNDMNWDSIIINTVKKLGVQHAGKLFVTINIIAKNKTFSINNITEYISIDEIFFGLPDPMLQEYCTQDPYIEHNFVKRYEEKYQIDILEQNAQIYKNSPQNISNSPFYAGFRISHLLQEGLNKKGYSLMFDTIKEFKNTESLATALASYYHKDYTEMYEVVQDVLSSAFNTKYGAYSYENDTRSVDNSWLERFKNILDSSIDTSIHRIEIIDVGVGSGHEAVKLFNGYDDVTFVDIATAGNVQQFSAITQELHGHSLMPAVKNPATDIRNSEGALFCFEMISMIDGDYVMNPSLKPAYRADMNKRGFVRGIITPDYKFARYFAPVKFNTPADYEALWADNDVELLMCGTDETENLAWPKDNNANQQLVELMNQKLNALIQREIGTDDGSETKKGYKGGVEMYDKNKYAQ